MSDATFDEQPISHIPMSIQGARDLDDTEARNFEERVINAINTEELKNIADEIVSTTGYGTSHVMDLGSFAHAMAFSGLTHASALAKQLEAKGKKLSASGLVSLDEGFHGYRDTLYDVDEIDL